MDGHYRTTTTSSPLLSLPREIRDKIWHLVFANLVFAPFTTDYAPPISEDDGNPCNACQANRPKSILYSDAFRPLLTCKTMHTEAYPLLQSTGRLILTSLEDFQRATHAPTRICCETKSITLYVHLDDHNREDWMNGLNFLTNAFPHLVSLKVHNHMRPPLGYDALIDAIHIAGPLVKLPPNLSENVQIRFAYISEYAMFENAFMGVVRVSDALEEHEAVVRDLLRDKDFIDASEKGELHMMTNCLLRLARAYEKPWFVRLENRRRQELRRAETAADMSDGLGERGHAGGGGTVV